MSGVQGALKFWQEFNIGEFQVSLLQSLLFLMPWLTISPCNAHMHTSLIFLLAGT